MGALRVLFGLPVNEMRYALGYQMYGFREGPRQPEPEISAAPSLRNRATSWVTAGSGRRASDGTAVDEASSSRLRKMRLSGFGHTGVGGNVGLCDPASGLAFAMTTNKVSGHRVSSL